MGATNNLKNTNITLKLVGKECYNCSQNFTEPEIAEENFELYFDTTNEVRLENCYNQQGARKGWILAIWVRTIEHKDCPEINKDHE